MSASVITPIVFCASLVPCANDTSDADPIWPHRNVASRRRSGIEATTLNTVQVPSPATSPAITGANSAGRTMAVITPSHLTAPTPRAAIAAPISPPKRAWEDDDGNPNNQVSRFHKIPPTRPARMMINIGSPDNPGTGAPFEPWMAMILLLTVNATWIDKNAPTRF